MLPQKYGKTNNTDQKAISGAWVALSMKWLLLNPLLGQKTWKVFITQFSMGNLTGFQ
jgi:hypothetical protein